MILSSSSYKFAIWLAYEYSGVESMKYWLTWFASIFTHGYFINNVILLLESHVVVEINAGHVVDRCVIYCYPICYFD